MLFFHPFQLVLSVFGILIFIASYMALKKKDIPGANYMFPLLFSLGVWCFIDVAALVVPDMQFKLLMAKMRYSFVALISMLFLLFIIDYTNSSPETKKRITVLSLIFPIITMIIVFTNNYHSLMWKSFYSIQNSGDIGFQRGIWFWISLSYYLVLLFVSLFLLAKTFQKATQLYKIQLFLIMSSLCFPIVFNLLFVSAAMSSMIYDLSPAAFSMTGIMIYFTISKLRRFDIIPVSKEIIMENMHEGILILDEHLALSDYNKKICEILDVKEIPSMFNVIEKLPHLIPLIESNTNIKEEYFSEKLNKNLLIDLSVLKDHSERNIGRVIIITDFTKQKEYEKNLKVEIEKAENANKAKSEFIANLSHEIRTPLNAIIGFSEILENKLQDHNLLHYFEGIKNSSRTLLGLINDILDLSKSEAGKITLNYNFCDLTNIITSIRNIFLFEVNKKNIEFKIMLHHNLPKYIFVDEVRLKQILINIIGNAVKFTDKGSVSVEVFYEPYEDAGKLLIRVKDSGIGIQESQLERIFDAFSQQDGQDNRKYGGTGLGLTITKKLVELMNGRIEVSSAYGKGSVFTIILTNVASRGDISTPKETPPLPSDLSFSGIKILYAEDNEMNRMVVDGLLTHYNATVIDAVNGKEAVDFTASEHPDIILMDITMPVMDGLTATKLIRSNPDIKHTPIIALTATIIESPTDEALFDDIVNKPFRKDDLLYKIYSNTIKKGTPLALDKSLVISESEKEELSNSFTAPIHKILSGIVLDDVLSLAEQLSKYAANNKIDSVSLFSDELKKYCQDYDIKKIRKSLEDFLTKLKY